MGFMVNGDEVGQALGVHALPLEAHKDQISLLQSRHLWQQSTAISRQQMCNMLLSFMLLMHMPPQPRASPFAHILCKYYALNSLRLAH